MWNCLKPVIRSEISYEENKAEEAKPLVITTLHDQVVLSDDNCWKERKIVRFKVQSHNAVDTGPAETNMRPPRMGKSVRVKVVLTQSELKQILNRATVYHQAPPPSQSPASSSVDQISGRIMVKCRSRRSPVMSKCSWNPALHTIPE